MEGEFNFLYVFIFSFVAMIVLGVYSRRNWSNKWLLNGICILPIVLAVPFLNMALQSDFRIIPWEFGLATGLGISSILNLLIFVTIGIEKSTLKSLERYYQYIAAENGLVVSGFDPKKSLAENNRSSVTLHGQVKGRFNVSVWFTYSNAKMFSRDSIQEKMKSVGGHSTSYMTIYFFSTPSAETFSFYCPKDHKPEQFPDRVLTGIPSLDEHYVFHGLNSAALVKIKQPDVVRYLLENSKAFSKHLSLEENGKFSLTLYRGSTKESDAEDLKNGIDLIHRFWEIYHSAGERQSDH
jgi:hypothetical protein